MDGDNLMITIITGIAVLIILIYYIKSLINYYNDMYIIADGPVSASKTITVFPGKIEESTIPTVREGEGLSYCISIWVYINPTKMTRNSRIIKNILARGNFILDMDLAKNQLRLKIPVYGENPNELIYDDFPSQKWVNIVICVKNRTVDLWLNAKLYKSVKCNNLILNNQRDNLLIAPSGGFDGTIGRTYYYKKNLSRREIIDIFDNGPYSSNFLSKLWDRTKVLILGKKADTTDKQIDTSKSSIPSIR
jgi:hypothetical protein